MDVSEWDCESFIAQFANVVERCPAIMAAVWSSRPFADDDHLQRVVRSTIDELSLHMKEGLLRCHPDLAGRLAVDGRLTRESHDEQGGSGLLSLPAADVDTLRRLNAAYRAAFGFPFVICVRENSTRAILDGLHARMRNSREREVDVAIAEVQKIASLRLADALAKSRLRTDQ